jgi:hypothetical protein
MPTNIVGAVYIIGLAEKGRGKKVGRLSNHNKIVSLKKPSGHKPEDFCVSMIFN